MKTLATLFAALTIALPLSASAQDLEAIKAAVKKKFPDAPIESVRKTAYGNLFELVGGGEILYTDAATSFLIVGGSIIDTKTRENVTEGRMRQVNAISFDSLPLDSAIKIVRGNGSRRIAVFEDPNCGYCKTLERDLAGVQDLTMYVFLYPILSPDSTEKSKAVWCAKDRSKAWLDLMLKNERPASASCDTTAIDKTLAYGQSKRINGTPTMIFEDGERLPGVVPMAQLEQRLQDAKLAAAKTAAAKPAAK